MSHAKLPVEFLNAMVTLRIHLDDCDAETGTLLVLPGLHRDGVLRDADLRSLAAAREPMVMAARAGDALIMSPLTPHASRRATKPSRRRVLHIEYCALPLPAGVEWLEAA
jgi:ectoine hydroxylase-related dioxygenase (phytanoyl-CoA dioxygenase family)